MRDHRSIVIDGLRGVASIAVALYHFNHPDPGFDDFYHRAIAFGYLGVPVFFAVSGYCVMQARANSRWLPYLQRRLLRIYPPYWASLVLLVWLGVVFQLKYGVHNERLLPTSMYAIFGNISCLVGAPFQLSPMNPPSWSLTYELAFYLVVTTFVSQLRTWGVLALCVVALALRTSWFPLDLWGAFGLGVATYMWKENRLLAGTIASLSVLQIGRDHGALYAGVGMASALVIVSGVDVRNRTLASLLSGLGAISYSLYLVHVPIGIYLQRILLDRFLAAELPGGIARDLGLLIACLAVAFVFYRLIEKPSHEFAKRVGSQSLRCTTEAATRSSWHKP